MSLHTCLCGAKFAGVDTLHEHAISRGHFYQCMVDGCRRFFQSNRSAQDHQETLKHVGTIKRLALLETAQPNLASSSSVALKCAFCDPNKKPFKDITSLKQHQADKHPTCSTCPSCNQAFLEKSKRLKHQRAAGHCYCREDDVAFGSEEEFRRHMQETLHTTGFQCLDCEREFSTQLGLDHHLMACPANTRDITPQQTERAKAAFEAMEEANLRCEECQRTFKDVKAFHQHKKSVKHRPLANLTCNVSPGKCDQRFTSYSAWFFHIESGKCKSSMNRRKLYGIVHGADGERLITHAGNGLDARSHGYAELPRSGISPGSRITDLESEIGHLSIAELSSSGVILTPEESETSCEECSTGGTILTPSISDIASDASSSSGVLLTPTASTYSRGEWSFLTDSYRPTPLTTSVDGSSVDTVTYENLAKIEGAWPCSICTRKFKTKDRLVQHLKSPAHAPKLFHCPPAAALGLAVGKPGKNFKTLSGFAQHVEAGACDGSVDMLKNLIDVCQDKSKAVAGSGSKLFIGAI